MSNQNEAAGHAQEGNWKTLYEEVCRQHDRIIDFRAKLLGLVPLASGGGIFLLLGEKVAAASHHLLAVGIFGCLTTLGLFLYELRGIQKCLGLIDTARQLEGKLGREEDLGAFTKRQGGIGMTELAALTIYPTVLGGWTYVACLGAMYLAGLMLPPDAASAAASAATTPASSAAMATSWPALVVPVAVVVVAMGGGGLMVRRSHKKASN